MPLLLRLLFLESPRPKGTLLIFYLLWGLAELHLPFVEIISAASFLKNLVPAPEFSLLSLFKLELFYFLSLPTVFLKELLLALLLSRSLWFSLETLLELNMAASLILSILTSLSLSFYRSILFSRDDDPWFGLTIITDLFPPFPLVFSLFFILLCPEFYPIWWLSIIQLLCNIRLLFYWLLWYIYSFNFAYILSVFVFVSL